MSIESQTALSIEKHFFVVDDGGAGYTIVATDVEHAKAILRNCGVEFTKDDGDSAPIDDPEFASLVWGEIRNEAAATITVDDDGTKRPLIECAIGDWFSSEY